MFRNVLAQFLLQYTNPDPRDFIFTDLNQPFAPVDRRNAKELVSGGSEYSLPGENVPPGYDSIRNVLVKSWSDVDAIARKLE